MRGATRRLRVGIVGCGVIAQERHIPAYRRLRRRAEVVAVCDRNQRLADETARRSGFPRAYQSLVDMLAEERLDVVDLCVPPKSHAQLAFQAIAADCHVLVEKPMALSVDECDQMIRLAMDRKVHLSVVHNNLFHPPFRRAVDAVSKGLAGEFVGMHILLSTPREEMLDNKRHWYHELPGGLVGETGPHVAYMARAFIPDVTDVNARGWNRTRSAWTSFDDYLLEISGEQATCSARLVYSSSARRADVRIFGTKQILAIDLNGMTMTVTAPRSLAHWSVGVSALKEIAQLQAGLVSNAASVGLGRYRLGTEVVIERFIMSIFGECAVPVTPQDGREAVRIMEATVSALSRQHEREHSG